MCVHVCTHVYVCMYLHVSMACVILHNLLTCFQVCPLPKMTTPQCGATPNLYLHGCPPCGQSGEMTESPDSGHKEMSSDSLSCTQGEWLLPCPLRMCDSACPYGHPGRVDSVHNMGSGVAQNSTSRGHCMPPTPSVLSVDLTNHKVTRCSHETQTDDSILRGREGEVLPLIPPPKVSLSNPLCLSSKITRNCNTKPAVSRDIACPAKTNSLPITKPPSRNLFLQVQSLYKDICKRKTPREPRHPRKNAATSKSSPNTEADQQGIDNSEADHCHKKSPQNASCSTLSFETKHSPQTTSAQNNALIGAVGDLGEQVRGANKSCSEDTAPLLPVTLDTMTLDEFASLP